MRYIYKTLSHGKERDEEKRLAKPQTEPTFLCIFDTVQVTKVPTINVKNLMALFCEREKYMLENAAPTLNGMKKIFARNNHKIF